MRCTTQDCPGTYEPRKGVHTVRRDDQIVVISHVPAEVCTVCGDVLFAPETVRRLEALRHTTAPPERTVPLYEFTDVVSASSPELLLYPTTHIAAPHPPGGHTRRPILKSAT